MSGIDDIIQRLGGAEAAARLTGVGLEAVRKWRQSGAVPSKHWAAVSRASGIAIGALSGADLAPDGAAADRAPDGAVADRAPDGATKDGAPDGATAVLVLADGSVIWGVGVGAFTDEPGIGEVCFSTGLTGYQETLTDPSFAGQIITFTLPHVGNVGTNRDDLEADAVAARGVVLRELPTAPSSWRSTEALDGWLRKRGVPGIAGVDTRALTLRIRDGGFVTGVLSHPADRRFDVPGLLRRARDWPGLEGMDLARGVSCMQSYAWDETRWAWDGAPPAGNGARPHVVAVDYGAKRNILRSLIAAGCRVTVVPAETAADGILRHRPDGVFLSNGPGDPAATAAYAVPAIQGVLAAGVPVFGICLGHQMLALALGARTYKLRQGHRGANQPVRELTTGRVEITSQNHGFAVEDASLPEGVVVTHTSLFDGSNEGIACAAKRCFSVQYHPEAGPGPSDAQHLFGRFTEMMKA